MQEKLGAAIELVASDGGVYEVVVDGKKIFSKKALNRFPEDGEIVRIIQE